MTSETFKLAIDIREAQAVPHADLIAANKWLTELATLPVQ
jgi:hypothetical protein